MAMTLSVCSLTSCGGFMQGLAAGMGGYGNGGYNIAPNYNTVSAPSTVWSTPNYDFCNTWTTAPTYNTSATYSSGSSSFTSGSSTSTSSSSSSSGRSCGVCYGLGKCRTCNGKGTYFDDLNGKYNKCPNCTNGLCTSCGGTGRK